MKKILIALIAFMLVSGAATPTLAAGRGGVMGFIAGCCFGIRAGAQYNDGKDIHWREWIQLIPFVGFVVAIWNGIDGANGVTAGDYAAKYGSTFY